MRWLYRLYDWFQGADRYAYRSSETPEREMEFLHNILHACQDNGADGGEVTVNIVKKQVDDEYRYCSVYVWVQSPHAKQVVKAMRDASRDRVLKVLC